MRLDADKSGTINRDELASITHQDLGPDNQKLWQEVIEQSDQNGDGVIDFEEFISACVSRQVLHNEKAIKMAFNILDKNKDGRLTLDDFDDMFASYGGTFDNDDLWNQLLAEADTNNDGAISYEEFHVAM